MDLDQKLPVASTLTESKVRQIVMVTQANDETDESGKESIDIEPQVLG